MGSLLYGDFSVMIHVLAFTKTHDSPLATNLKEEHI